MTISGRLATGVLSGLLLAASYAPAGAGPNRQATTKAQSAVGSNGDEAILGFLGSIMPAPTQPLIERCEPETLYSQHDVIGDPEACFRNHFDVRAGSTNPGVAPAF